MIDVLLVNPKQSGDPFERIPPLGLAYIAARLEQDGLSVRIADFEVEEGTLEDRLSGHSPRLVGISGTTHTRHESFGLVRRVKRFNPGITTVYGGVHATFTGPDTLRNVPEVDIVVRGEGEETMSDLVRACKAGSPDLARVPGITWRRNGEAVENPPRARVFDLDVLGSPAWHRLSMDRYALRLEFTDRRGVALVSSRGCPAKCVFCSASAMFGHRVSWHSPGYVASQVELLTKDYGYQGIRFFDSTFTIRRSHVEGVCDEIERRGLSFPWECEVRVGTVDRPLLERMQRAGCYYVDFGIESGSQRVLDRMGKGFLLPAGQELLDLCAALGVRTKVFFSLGHIGETMADVEDTFRFIDRNRSKISTMACGAGVRIYPGTYLEEYALANGLLPPGFSWSGRYSDSRLVELSQDPGVPLLVQPQLGYVELSRIRLRIIGQRFRGWRGAARLVQKLFRRSSYKRLGDALRLVGHRLFGRR